MQPCFRAGLPLKRGRRNHRGARPVGIRPYIEFKTFKNYINFIYDFYCFSYGIIIVYFIFISYFAILFENKEHTPNYLLLIQLKMKQTLLIILFLFTFLTYSRAQLPDGSTAPDFTTTDIYGQTHNLYSYLDQGYTVILKFTATWCGPCWNYHNTGALEDTWDTYGPDGTNEAIVLFLESDPSTSIDCLYGNCGNTQGNWVAGTNFPIVNDHNMAGPYQISYYPTIMGICPSKKTTLLGQVPSSVIGNFIANCSIINYDASVSDVSCNGHDDGIIALVNVSGAEPVTFQWNNGHTSSYNDNLAPGFYQCTMTDAQGNITITDEYFIDQPEVMTLDVINLTNIDCFSSDGYVAVQAGGGNGGYSYMWSNGQFGNQLFTSQSGYYLASATDSQGCEAEVGVDILDLSDGPAIDAGFNLSLLCNVEDLQLQGSGPTGSQYQINWSTLDGNILYGGTTYTPTVNAGGTYSLTVFDLNTGCESSDDVFVDANSGFNLNLNSEEISCAGSMDGALTVIPSNGSGPFNYLWSNGGNSNEIENLSGGFYGVTVSDGAGCTQTASIILEEPDPVTVSINQTGEINCFGDSTGSAEAEGQGGEGLTYLWSNGETSESISNLSAGVYYLTVENNEGCSVVDSIVISQPIAIQISLQVEQISMAGEDDGSITASVTGGEGNYDYAWSNGESTPTIENLAAGTYTVTVTDENDCIKIATTVINSAGCALEIGMELSQAVSCNGDTDAVVTVVVEGNVGNVSYTWSSNVDSNTATAENLGAGIYSVTVSDEDGCTEIAEISVGQPNPLEVSMSISEITEPGGNDGGASTDVTGGVDPYSYIWSTGDTTASVSGLSHGAYFVTITDANGCEIVGVATIPVFQCSFDLGIEVDEEINCFGDTNGALSATHTTHNGEVTYWWSNQEVGQSINGLGAGEYYVVAVDEFLCTDTAYYELEQPDLLAVNFAITNESIEGAADGSITAHVSGGTNETGYDFLWSTGEITTTINGLSAGEYCVTVNDDNGCATVHCSNLYVSGDCSSLEIDVVIENHVICYDTPSGNATVVVHGGTAPYEISLDSDNSLEALPAGIHTASVEDSEGCIANIEFEILGPESDPRAHIVDYSSIINAEGTGFIEVEAEGGWGDFTIVWWHEGEIIASDTLFVDGLNSGIYSVEITDAGGCATFKTFEIILNTSNHEYSFFSDIKVFPNPVKGDLTIELNNKNLKLENYEIISSAGQVIKQTSVINENNISTIDLAPGLYLLKLRTEKGSHTIKFIKI